MDIFFTVNNLEIVWEVVFDNIKHVILSHDEYVNTKQFFMKQAQSFHQFEKKHESKKDLIHLNKEFISKIISILRKPPQKELLLREDIQTERMNHFDRVLSEKKTEFTQAFQTHVPEKLDFSEPIDTPIGESINELISQTLAQRNFDIEKIKKTIEPPQHEYKYQKVPKLITIGEEINIDEEPHSHIKKTISWGENISYETGEIDFKKEFKEEINGLNEKVDALTLKVTRILEYLENKIDKDMDEKIM
jgi:hypothetical protein